MAEVEQSRPKQQDDEDDEDEEDYVFNINLVVCIVLV